MKDSQRKAIHAKKLKLMSLSEFKQMESSRMDWISASIKTTNKISQQQMKVNRKDVFTRTKIHQDKLKRLLKTREFEYKKIAQFDEDIANAR